MNLSTRRHYLSLLRRLRLKAPPRYPVRVERRTDPDHPDAAATVDLTKRRGRLCFVISIPPEMPECLLCDALLHEWAHALTWTTDPEVKHHGAEWGAAYARVYDIWEPPFSWQRRAA